MINNTLNIIYVEDNEGDAELFKMCFERYLSSINVTIEIAETIAEAKVIYNANYHNVVFIDWNLPDGEGIEFTEWVRKKHPEIPLFMVSGLFTDEHIRKAESYNVTACIQKTYSKGFVEHIISLI